MKAGKGLKKATLLFLVFLVLWTPYRYLTGILGWRVLHYMGHLQFITESIAKLTISFGLVYLFLKKYNDSWKDVGLKKENAFKSAALAIIGSLSVMAAYLAMGGELRPEPLGLIYLFLVVGPTEELVSRGYYFSIIMRDFGGKRGFLFASMFSSIYFSLGHVPIDIFVANYGMLTTFFHLSIAFLIGLILAGYYHIGGDNLLGPSILHAMVDVCGAYIIFLNPKVQFISIIAELVIFTIILLLWAYLPNIKGKAD